MKPRPVRSGQGFYGYRSLLEQHAQRQFGIVQLGLAQVIVIEHVVEAIAVLQPDERRGIAAEIVFESSADHQGHPEFGNVVARILILQ